VLAALRTLAASWSKDPTAMVVLRLAAASSDPEIRQGVIGEGP
jgi:hypothetical protein